MKAAVLHEFGKPPRYEGFADPEIADGHVWVTVRAAALKPIDKQLAAGTHYGKAKELPVICGTDGIGELEDGTRVFFVMPAAPFGTMAEYAAISPSRCWTMPNDLDDLTAAAIFNPGLSAFASLQWGAALAPGETVLILGATGVTGRLAVQTAKLSGAKRVVAAGRNAAALAELTALGADALVPLNQSDEKLAEALAREAGEGYNVILDYIWGHTTEVFLSTVGRTDMQAGSGGRMRLVQVGEGGGATISLPAAVLRSSRLEIVGAGTGSAVLMAKWKEARDLLIERFCSGALKITTQAVPLADVETAWHRETSGQRIVFVP